MLCGLECLISPNVDDDRRSRRAQNLGKIGDGGGGRHCGPFQKFSNMIGSENDRVQIICIRTGMKEIDGGANLRSTIADRPLAFETAGWPAGLTSLVQESRRDRRNLRPSSHTRLPTFVRRSLAANCPCKRVAT